MVFFCSPLLQFCTQPIFLLLFFTAAVFSFFLWPLCRMYQSSDSCLSAGSPACRAEEHTAGSALPGTESSSKQILRPLAAGSKGSHRVGNSTAQHLARVSCNSHAPGFTHIHTEKKKQQKNQQTKPNQRGKKRKKSKNVLILKFAAKTLFSTLYAEKRGVFSSPGKIKH